LPIIALTANAFPEDVAAAKEAGMQAHLAKPINFSHLAQTLQRWLPTRIVEAPMDRDVISEEGTTTGPTSAPNATPEPRSSRDGDDSLHARWLRRRENAVEAVRQGLAEGLICNTNKRRSRDRADREELLRLIHKLAGTAASFGEPELGEHASNLEGAMMSAEPCEECEAIAFALLALADEPPSEFSKVSASAG
jgi:HPt (histidine-containing phosphotransfer) domain-containing protein